MRRPICLPALSFAAGIFFGFQAGVIKFAVLAAVCAVIIFFVLKAGRLKGFKRFKSKAGRLESFENSQLMAERFKSSKSFKSVVCVAAVFFIVGAAWFFIKDSEKDVMLSLAGTETRVAGVVRSIEMKKEYSIQFVLEVSGTRSKVLVNVYGDWGTDGPLQNYSDMAGRRVTVFGTPELPSGRRNPKTFDYRLYLRTRGIRTVMNVSPSDITADSGMADIFANILSNARYSFSQDIIKAMNPRDAGLLIGMLFGDKNMLGDDVYEMFQKNGTAHILAVSGIHVGIIYLLINGLLKARRNIFLNAVLLLAIFMYAALASFSPSVLRAGGMIALHIISKILCMRYDMLCAGAGIAFIMMLFNPLIIFDVGFLLSFLAIFTLAIVLPAALRALHRGTAAALVMQVGLAPVTAYFFNYFSFAAFFINIPVIFIAGIIMPAGLALIPLSFMPEPVFSACAGFAGALCELMYILNEFTYARGGMFFNVISPPLWALFVFYGLMFFFCTEVAWIFRARREKKKLITVSLIIIVLSVAFTVPFQDDFHRAQLVFVDVGQGDCLHIRTPGGKNILIDGGGSRSFDVGKKILMPYLLKNGVDNVDMVFVTHRHLDHYGGIVSLAGNFKIGKLFLYEANRAIERDVLDETGLEKGRLAYLSRGQKIIIDEDVFIEVLYPEKKSDGEYAELTGEDADENDISLVMKVHFRGVSVLMTGDINSEGEDKLISACGDAGALKSDFLKVPHHGSKYSSSDEFISAVAPSYAVFQVGKNTFGHPTEEVLDKCSGIGAEIYRNDRHGAIGIFIEPGKANLTIKTIVSTIVSEKV